MQNTALKIQSSTDNGNVCINLVGDFNTPMAYEIMDYLKENHETAKSIVFLTDNLQGINGFAIDIFHSYLRTTKMRFQIKFIGKNKTLFTRAPRLKSQF
jgi:hypothetical protein